MAAFSNETGDRGLGCVEHGILMEEVFVGIGGDAQFGKERQRRLRFRCAARQLQGPLEIELRIGDSDEWGADSRSNELVGIDRMKKTRHNFYYQRSVLNVLILMHEAAIVQSMLGVILVLMSENRETC